ncbi:DUF3365 domain-containing protein [Pleurocapsa sp. PCC 7319]|uniref:Tll0287-like domain-containing protein n=1 Tax=Pleurocapsa sp. PCC 7319 TaxID=118161 RepID=UPI000346921A|nr:DUF3365 domain-containing protein [Pleurocapsa sp. PCC 7319]
MFKNFRSRQKLTLLLVLILVASLIIFSIFLSAVLQQNAKNQISSKAMMLMETINSIGDYTKTHVQPELINRIEVEFVPEIIPNFAAREIFKNFRQKPNYRDFFYKDATLNPLNSEDQADNFETEIIENFREYEEVEESRGFRSALNGDLFYLARPLKVYEPSCLECHGEPSAAPPSLVERYGSVNGFGWKLNEIVGAQIISLPANQVINEARQLFFLIIGIISFLFLAVIYVGVKLLNKVGQPIQLVQYIRQFNRFQHRKK